MAGAAARRLSRGRLSRGGLGGAVEVVGPAGGGGAEATGGASLGPDLQCEMDGGPGITGDVARMLACDCSFVAMSMNGAVPESVGAKVRTVTAAMRRKLRKRDRGCRWPGCTQ